MIRKLSLAIITAVICAAMTTAALASQTGQNTVSVENSAGEPGQKIVTVSSEDEGGGQKIVTVEPSAGSGGQKIVEVGGQAEKTGGSDHKIVTVSGGDTYSVEGEGKSPRLSYEEFGEYSYWGFSDGGYYDGYDDGYAQSYSPVSQDDAAVSVGAVSGTQAVGYYDNYYDGNGYYDDGYYDDNGGYYGGYNGDYNGGYYDDGHVEERGGGASGMLIFVALAIGAVVGFTYYFSTKSAYENAGIGVVYDLKENAVLKLGNTRDASGGIIDRQIETRSHVDRGYYGRSAGQVQSGQYSGGVISPNMSGGRPQQMNGAPRPPQMPQGGMRPPKR